MWAYLIHGGLKCLPGVGAPSSVLEEKTTALRSEMDAPAVKIEKSNSMWNVILITDIFESGFGFFFGSESHKNAVYAPSYPSEVIPEVLYFGDSSFSTKIDL